MGKGPDDGYPVVVGIRDADVPGGWRRIETGLRAAILEDAGGEGEIVIPYGDGMTAEECARIITGTIRREAE